MTNIYISTIFFFKYISQYFMIILQKLKQLCIMYSYASMAQKN